MLVDTNVLIAAFLPGEDEEKNYYALYTLEEYGRPILVPIAVVVEALSFIIGGRKTFRAGLYLLAWLNTLGRATIVPSHRPDVYGTFDLMQRLSIDCVDAMLAELATDMTETCVLKPAMPIVTWDSDFWKMSKKNGLNLSVFDPETQEEQEIG
jgi:predicted nucleic acid-binding protein